MKRFFIENKDTGEICESNLKTFKNATKLLKYYAWYENKNILTKDTVIIKNVGLNGVFEDEQVKAWVQ